MSFHVFVITYMCDWGFQSRNGVGHPEAGVRGGYESTDMGAGIKLPSSAKTVLLLASEASCPPFAPPRCCSLHLTVNQGTSCQ